MRRTTTIATVALLVAWLFPADAGPARAASGGDPDNPDPKDTHCLAEFDVTFDPGISKDPSQGTFTTGGESGTNTCDGPINGFEVTGVGTRGEDGRYAIDAPDTCQDFGGTFDFTFSFTQPTTGGPQKVTGYVGGTYGPLRHGGLFGGSFTGERMYGKFTATPLEGDCITAPVTKVRIRCDEWVVPRS